MLHKIISRMRWWLSRNNPKAFWTNYNVTLHANFETRKQSLDYFNWRNAQYLFYDELMPTAGFDGKVILDYGCGPCHDMVGFVENSKPSKLVGADISQTSLHEGGKRLKLHASDGVELLHLDADSAELQFEDGTFDYIHSSGVLHHIEEHKMLKIIKEFNRILKDDGTIRIMVYNYSSVWLHLNAAYKLKVVNRMHDKSLEDVFRISTDTRFCPISRCYRPEEFISMCNSAGFDTKLLGCAVSLAEMKLLPERFVAIQDKELPEEHRQFLLDLKFDAYGRPVYKGEVAGLDAVYELRKR